MFIAPMDRCILQDLASIAVMRVEQVRTNKAKQMREVPIHHSSYYNLSESTFFVFYNEDNIDRKMVSLVRDILISN